MRQIEEEFTAETQRAQGKEERAGVALGFICSLCVSAVNPLPPALLAKPLSADANARYLPQNARVAFPSKPAISL